MATARRSSEVRQAELTDAALQIIATRGIAALSTRSLADAVGLSTGAIFRHFASLEALLDAVVARVERVLDSTFPPPDLPPRERLERFVEARSTVVGNQLGILRLILSDQFLLALPEASAARLAGCVRQSRELVVGCLRAAQAAGEVRRDVEAEALAVVVLGTIQMLAVSTTHPHHRAAHRTVREALATLLQPPAPPRAKTRKAPR